MRHLFIKQHTHNYGVGDISFSDKDTYCVVCALAKFVRKSFKQEHVPATCVGQIMHADIIGPITPETFGSKLRYILIVVDGYLRYIQTFMKD